MRMLDLGCGKKGASEAFRRHGWDVVTLDIDPRFDPDVVADMRIWSPGGYGCFDLVWASPPCDEFAKFAMPCWYPPETLPNPDMSLVMACKRIIDECKPRYWVIENVRGAVPFFEPILGKPAAVFNSYFLWGFFPPIAMRRSWGTKTKHLSSSAKAERARIPLEISEALVQAVESCAVLL
jgi:hypothetical protein